MSAEPNTRPLRLPVLARPVVRDATRPGSSAGGPGVDPAAVDCSKLRGLARDMCYRSQARRR
jgi:hypothetical protein